MTKVTVAFGSFIVGAVFGSLFLGIHTSTLAQARSSSLSSDGKPYNMVGMIDEASKGEAVGFSPNGLPNVPPIMMRVSRLKITNGGSQTIDGLLCDNCEFHDATLKYSGGAFQFTNFKFTGTTKVEVSGAAANTFAFMRLMNAIAAGSPAPKVEPNKPLEQIAIAKVAFTASLRSPFIGPGK
jgi:hypothetical protein